MKRAAKLLTCLTLFSLFAFAGAGCAAKPEVVTVRQVYTPCPRPAPLTGLPLVDGNLPLDSLANVDALTARHLIVFAHIDTLNAALDCYEAQAKKDAGHE